MAKAARVPTSGVLGIWPVTFVLKGGGTRQAGYDLPLSGAHEHDWDRPDPGLTNVVLSSVTC